MDDLDRAAPALSRFLHSLFAAATERGLPLAVVATHGPGWADMLPGAGDRRRRVPLPPLGTVDTGRLLRHLLGRAGRPAALARDLLPLVGGNPAVAEAYVRALDAGGGGSDGPVPDPVRRIVDRRLDRLDGDHRAVLMAGATLGPRFAATTVERLLGWTPGRAEPMLRHLVAGGLLRRPTRGGYAVAEPAVAQVARHRLPRAIRAEFARRAGAEATRLVGARPGADPTRRAGAQVGAACAVGAGTRLDGVPGPAALAGVAGSAHPDGVSGAAGQDGRAEAARPVAGGHRRHPAAVTPRRTTLIDAGVRSVPRDRPSGSGAAAPRRTEPQRVGASAAGGRAGSAQAAPIGRSRWGSSTPARVRALGAVPPPGLATVGPAAARPTTGRRGSVRTRATTVPDSPGRTVVVPLVGSPRPRPRRPRPVAPLTSAAPGAAPSTPAGSPILLSEAPARRRRTGFAAAGPNPLAA